MLRRAGFEVTVALSGKEAISLLKTLWPTIVISDCRMPDISGLEVLRHARKRCPGAIRILISGYSEEGALDRAVEEDACFLFFSKPWDDASLVAEICKRTVELEK